MVANVLAFHLDNGSQQAGFHCLLSAKVFAWLSTRPISAEGCAHSRQIALSPAFRALDTHDLRRGLRAQWANRTLACISRTRHATISAEGCAHSGQIALSPVFCALDTHDLRRGLRAQPANRTLACISRTRHARSPQRVARTAGKSHSRLSRTRHARSPQRVARAAGKSHSRLHFAHSTRTISAEGCAHSRQIALSPAFRALDTHDLRRGLRAQPENRTLACISRTRHARSPQRVARAPGTSHSRLHFAHSTRTIPAEGCAGTRTSHSRLHFAHSTRTISAEGCAGTRHIALSPAFRALDTHDLRRGLHFRLTLFVPPSAFKREFIKCGVFSIKWGKFFH